MIPHWSEADKAAVKRLRAEGRSLREIARALARTKDAVAGQARRLRRIATEHELPARRPEGWTLSPVHWVTWTPPAAAVPSPRPPPVRLAWRTCQYPLWPDGADLNHPDYGSMCGQPSLPQRSYCATHHARCTAQIRTEPPPEAPGEVLLTRGDQQTDGGQMDSMQIPGSLSFTIVLKASEADWVRAAAAQHETTPDELIRSLVAQARASDASKGGRLPTGLDLAERRRVSAGIGG
jgi:hypothetical protein